MATTILEQTSPGNIFFSAQSPHALGSNWTFLGLCQMSLESIPFKKSGALKPRNLKDIRNLRMDADQRWI